MVASLPLRIKISARTYWMSFAAESENVNKVCGRRDSNPGFKLGKLKS